MNGRLGEEKVGEVSRGERDGSINLNKKNNNIKTWKLSKSNDLY